MTPHPLLQTLSIFLTVLTAVCYLYQTVYLFLPLLLRRRPQALPRATRYAVLICARNEEATLPHLLDSILAQDYPHSLITPYVIADNCTDRTAAVAAAHGARVVVRFNQEKVGKGYALQYLLEHIRLSGELDNFDAFLVFDADNLLAPDYIDRINRVCSSGYEAFCGYRNTKNYGANWLSAGYGLWFLHESTHLNRSRMLIGSCCAVSGTGFGFTRALLDRMGGWNFFTLTEDIEFGTWCATRGIRIGYCHDAVLYDEQPTSFETSVKQRTRWVQGGVQVSLRYGGDFLRGLLQGGRTAYASFEMATLSLWGYGMGAVSFGVSLLAIFLAEQWAGMLEALLLALAGAYLSLFFTGALTMAAEWERVRASRAAKIGYLFTFPLFMMSYVPISLTALFRKFQWQPIAHTVAISVDQLTGPGRK